MEKPEHGLLKSLIPDLKIQTDPREVLRRLGLREQALIYLGLLAVSELFVSIWEPHIGSVMHGLILMVLIIHAAIFSRGTWQKFLLSLAIAPLLRLLSLTMPLLNFPLIYWYLLVGAPLFITIFLVMRYANLSRSMVGLTYRMPMVQLLVGITGIGFGWMEYLILRPNPLVEELNWRFIWLPALILIIFTGFLEELIFRGVMQYTAIRRFGRFGILFVAAVFAVLHFGYRSIIDVFFVFTIALLFAYIVHRTGSLLGVTISHGLINVSLFLIFPFVFSQPVEQLPVPQDILAPPAAVSVTPIIISTRTPTPTYAASPTPMPETATITPIPASLFTPTVLPAPVTPQNTATVCVPRSDWVFYTVEYGDTWFGLSQRYQIPILSLQQANCLESDALLLVGQKILVPYIITLPTTTPMPPPTNTNLPSPTNDSRATFTPTFVSPTATVISVTPTLSLPTEAPTPTSIPPSATQNLP